MLNYQLISGPVIEPVSLSWAKQHLRVAFDDDDSLIAALIVAARETCEQSMDRAIYNQRYVLSLDQFNYGDWRSTVPMERRNPLRFSALWDGLAIRLPMPRLVSVQSITYQDTNGSPATLDPATYTVDVSSQPGRIVPKSNLTWPTTDYYLPGSVQIAYTAGSYGDGVGVDTCPLSIKQAILLMVGHLYSNREAVVLTGSANSSTTLPLAFDSLLNPYRFYGLAV